MPSCNFGNLLVTDGTKTMLFFPEVTEPPPSFQSGLHSHVEALFKVLFPRRVIRISLCPYLRMPLNADGGGREKVDHLLLPLFRCEDASKDPSIWSYVGKVPCFYPSAWFVPVSSACPFPESLEEGVVNGVEDGFADSVTMIERPSTDHWIEFSNQFTGGQISAFFDAFPDLSEKRFDALLRRSDEEFRAFSLSIFTDCLPKKVEALFNMSDDGFLC